MRLLSVEELSKMTGIREQTIRRYAREKTLPAYRFGKHWRFSLEEVLAVTKGER